MQLHFWKRIAGTKLGPPKISRRFVAKHNGLVRMRVVVRARPGESVLECEPRVGRTIRAGLGSLLEDKQPYECFAAVLGPESTQREAFMNCGLPLLEAAIDGQRACLFAYGQTGSGKTCARAATR
eukprot:1228968-Prymnesium_polylepis.1